jgi:hypothetical protein
MSRSLALPRGFSGRANRRLIMAYRARRTSHRYRAQIQAEVLPRFLACYDRYRDFGFWAAPAVKADSPAGPACGR